MPGASTESQDPVNSTYAYIDAFVDELQRAGVRNVVICPGSRSTPLAMTFAAQPGIHTWMHVDERSAAYFGLGMAKRLRQPVALLCTSGTAAANFLPAIIEAKLTHVPLLVLTADRPHELRDNGAPQSIDQNRLYGSYVKWFVEIALPEATNAALRYIRTVAVRASALTRAIPAGPVHLNFPLREPLTPELMPDQPLPQVALRDLVAWKGRPDNTPYVDVLNAPASAPAATTTAYLMGLVHRVRRGLIIVGPNDYTSLAEPLAGLAQRLGYPILADPLSQLRCGDHDQGMILSSYDAFLRIDSFIESAQPELVVRFGAIPTSKPVLLYLKRYASCPLVVIDGHNGWEEPTQLASELIHADPAALCQDLLNALEQCGGKLSSSQEWITMWQDADRVTRQTIQATIHTFDKPFEGRVFTELANLLPDDTTLYVGNSMTVRDLDTFFYCTGQRIHIMGNRGANGIDGVVSSALGASAGAGQSKPTILVLGDLSFFHDLNGLLAARLHRLNLTIVLINNDGGGIFSFLPQAAYPEHFEQFFGTPTGLDFRLSVQMYGGQYQKVQNWKQFRKVVKRGLHSGGLHVIEVQTERTSNVKMHRQLWGVVGKALSEQGRGTRN
jgi:2-succinyl-5-enolpyruvyl-6-hydroxy-3-cyclohexene-1-carboxylate synthase